MNQDNKNPVKNNENYRNDFPILDDKSLVYFDSAATSLKPKIVINSIVDYYQKIGATTHSTDYKLGQSAFAGYEISRQIVADFLNCQKKEVVFCSSTTFAFNQIAFGLGKFLKKDDEIIVSLCEHSSLLLPFYRLRDEIGIVLKFVETNEQGLITSDKLKAEMTSKTKIVTFANINNSFGSINDVQELVKTVRSHQEPVGMDIWPFDKVLVLIDGAQGVAHTPTDVGGWDVDFLAFSGHKIFGPTGIGVWYAKEEVMKHLNPLLLGGGINSRMEKMGKYELVSYPACFEAGTPNMAGVIGLGSAINYVKQIGFDVIIKHQNEIKDKLVQEFKASFDDKVIIYNEDTKSGILLFNINNVSAEDVSYFLASKNICVRSGTFCAKLLPEVISCASAIRLSISIYNTVQDVEKIVSALKEGFDKGGDFLDEFFNE